MWLSESRELGGCQVVLALFSLLPGTQLEYIPQSHLWLNMTTRSGQGNVTECGTCSFQNGLTKTLSRTLSDVPLFLVLVFHLGAEEQDRTLAPSGT